MREVEKRFKNEDIPFEIRNMRVVFHTSSKLNATFLHIVLDINCPKLLKIRQYCNLSNQFLSKTYITVAALKVS